MSGSNSFAVVESNSSHACIRLVSAAIGQKSGSVAEILKLIAEAFNGFGCVLWEVSPGADPASDPPEGNLFVLAEWFRTPDRFALHELPINGSATGKVVTTRTPKTLKNVREEGGVLKDHHFLRQHDLAGMISVPIRFLEGSLGAINVYRQTEQPPFTDADLQLLDQFANVTPSLYQATRDHVSLELLREVDAVIRGAETNSIERVLDINEKREYLKAICKRIADTFHCLEVSLYLIDDTGQQGTFRQQATTWPHGVERESYEANQKLGVTGWVLQHERPVKLFDLREYSAEKKHASQDYPGLVWHRSERFLRSMKEIFRCSEDALPPISYMAAPISVGNTSLGAIRCCTAKESPYFYSQRELHLLELVGAQIGQCWSVWLDRRMRQRELENWRSIVDATNQLNSFVQTQLASRHFDERAITREALSSFAKHVPSVDALDIRLHDPATDSLFFAETKGRLWSEGTKSDVSLRRELTFPIGARNASPKSIGAYVFRKKESYEAVDVSKDLNYSNSGYFPTLRRLICVPIIVGTNVFGVLDVLGTTEQPFRRQVPVFAELLGRQLGLYFSLVRSMDQLRKAEIEARKSLDQLQELQRRQTQMFEDLSHQLKGPVRQARRRAELSLERSLTQGDLLALRGLLRKADRAAKTIRLLAELNDQKKISLDETPLDFTSLIGMLIDAAQDSALGVFSSRGIRFDVDRESFRSIHLRRVHVDYDLLEQAVNNVFDNAAKYSYENSTVRIFGGTTGAGRFHLSVSNKGLKIRPQDLNHCAERGWRSDEAQWTTGEGSGIGLWIVKNVMEAHDGELIIEPTNDEGTTIVKLVFPMRK